MQLIFIKRYLRLVKAIDIALIIAALLTATPLAVQAQENMQIDSGESIFDEFNRLLPSGISYPRSAEEFFEEGRRQLERETQQLLRRERDSSEPLLDIDSDLLVQDEAFREERESWLKNTDLLLDTTEE